MPLFSIITPIYNTPEPVFRAMVESVRSQSFTDWELCLVDDCSPSSHVRPLLEEYAALDPRIRIAFRPENGGIVPTSNDCLELATGEFVSFLDHDDELYPGALEKVAAVLAADPEVDYVYTDEDKLDEDGVRSAPFFKPDWSPERFRYQMYTCHFGTMRKRIVDEVGGFRSDFEGSQDFDLVFRVTERARRIVHLPEVLYGWRIIAGSAAGDVTAKPYAWMAGQRAIQAHCERVGFEAHVHHDMAQPGWYRLEPRLTEEPLVSIIIPTCGITKLVRGEDIPVGIHCLRTLTETSTYDNYEVVIVADTRTDPTFRAEAERLLGDRLTWVPFAKPFNFSEQINLGALHAHGEHLLLLNDDIEVITPDWIESMLMYSRHPGIGAVGAKLLYADGRIQHAGITTADPRSGPAHLYAGVTGDHPGYFSTLRVANNFLAVTAACLMTPMSVFLEVGGFSELFPASYNDVDYCLKLRQRGQRVAYNPEVEMIHHESASRDSTVSPVETRDFYDRWRPLVGHDPYYNGQLLYTPFAMGVRADYGLGRQRPGVRA